MLDKKPIRPKLIAPKNDEATKEEQEEKMQETFGAKEGQQITF